VTTFATGAELGPYMLLAKIGEGGMGEVWKARDTRLDRIVAIKRLKSEHGARFQQEARAIAALNHPHICQIYDVGPDYLVLEYIEGKPLIGPLARSEVVRVALQIAAALEAAHAKGILHRDLKPGNILITQAGAKLLDFGLAKLVADGDATQTIGVAGTPLYMSPEQTEGRALDARSDVFSFGAVAYELLAGHRAFDSLGAVLRDEPAVLHNAPDLARIVMRCLQKAPADRFQSFAELKAALDQYSMKPADQQPSIAVLPFSNMSADKENEYFSDGLAEEILNLLAKSPELKVIARTSSFAFRGKEQDIRKIGEALDVGTVLEGSVRRAGSRIRVTAQLIDIKNGAHLWSERYDRELTDIFEVQDEMAAAIAGALKVKLGAPPPAVRHIPRLDAYEVYLKARHQHWQLTRESMVQAREFYELAIRLDPQFALAHSGLADYFLTLSSSLMPAHEAAPRIRAEAQKALELDPSLPEAHAMLGAVAFIYDFDYAEAQRRFGLAMASEPVPPLVRDWYAVFFLASSGRVGEALEQVERAMREDPLNPMFHCTRCVHLTAIGRHTEAETEFRRALELNPNFWVAYWLTIGRYLSRGMPEQELACAERFYSFAPWSPMAVGSLAGMLVRTGDAVRAREVLRQIEEGQKYGHPAGLAIYQLFCGDVEAAADWMERAIEQRVPHAALHRLIPIYAALHANPRWPKLAKMMNLPEASA
jgi:TolB-like protein/Tfp pilus assembly protein PilF/predicted Ser/Thr protein kinase